MREVWILLIAVAVAFGDHVPRSDYEDYAWYADELEDLGIIDEPSKEVQDNEPVDYQNLANSNENLEGIEPLVEPQPDDDFDNAEKGIQTKENLIDDVINEFDESSDSDIKSSEVLENINGKDDEEQIVNDNADIFEDTEKLLHEDNGFMDETDEEKENGQLQDINNIETDRDSNSNEDIEMVNDDKALNVPEVDTDIKNNDDFENRNDDENVDTIDDSILSIFADAKQLLEEDNGFMDEADQQKVEQNVILDEENANDNTIESVELNTKLESTELNNDDISKSFGTDNDKIENIYADTMKLLEEDNSFTNNEEVDNNNDNIQDNEDIDNIKTMEDNQLTDTEPNVDSNESLLNKILTDYNNLKDLSDITELVNESDSNEDSAEQKSSLDQELLELFKELNLDSDEDKEEEKNDDTSDINQVNDESTNAESIENNNESINAQEEINKDSDEIDSKTAQILDGLFNNNPLDYEEKYNVPYREGVILKMRDNADFYPDYPDSNESTNNDEASENNQSDAIVNDNQEGETEYKTKEKSSEELSEAISINDGVYPTDANVDGELVQDKLVGSKYDDAIKDFVRDHNTILEQDLREDSTPIHLTIYTDRAVEVTSPNYDSAYPTNNIIDWVLEGNGRGVELNVSDLALNGALGDYLLVIPGGSDASRTDGLIFTYHLDEERKYRFTDVDRLFIRFVANPGMAFLRGFKLSVKLIAEPLVIVEEPVPDPEPLVVPPATLAVSMGGISAANFPTISEDFRLLIADMATMYINANDVNPGANRTADVTRITRTNICNIQWPNFESCVEVHFGVALVYEEDEEERLNEADLKAMWYTYVYQDPFATRLRRMGITEFSIPNDSAVLTAWMVIAVGVLISIVMLAFALWRFSCFEGYTRMQVYNDTDSLADEKKSADLFPAPNQILPPLYESDYQWDENRYKDSTRVNMDGFTNTGYTQDYLYAIDSDEEVVSPRDRKNDISSKDVYEV